MCGSGINTFYSKARDITVQEKNKAHISKKIRWRNVLLHQQGWVESESEVPQSCLTLCDPVDCSLPGSWDSPGKNTGVGCHFLLQGIFMIQGWNLGLPHCRQTL